MSSAPDNTETSSSDLSRRSLLLAMVGVAATVVLSAFDATIVSTTLPQAAKSLQGMSLYAWVGTGYLLANAASILVFGRLGDMYGRKPLMITAVCMVAVGSMLCGFAQSMPQLIAFRVLQGVGGGMMIATAFAAPADLFPDPKERVRWMALVSATFAVASGLGPVLGGAITQALGWRAAFFVIPVASIAALALLHLYFPRLRPSAQPGKRIDWVGSVLLLLVVGAPLMALELGFAGGGQGRPALALGLLCVAGLALWLLLRVERAAAWPIFPLRILGTATSRSLNVISLVTGAAMFIQIFYSPLLLQRELLYTPTQAGLLMTPLVMLISVGSMVNGWLFARQGRPQRLMVFGAVMLALGAVMVTLIGIVPGVAWIVSSFAVSGFALGFLLPNLTLFMQMTADGRDVGIASALVQTTRAMGSAVGTAAVGLLIAHTSVTSGIRLGLWLAAALMLMAAWMADRVRVKNQPAARGPRRGGGADAT